MGTFSVAWLPRLCLRSQVDVWQQAAAVICGMGEGRAVQGSCTRCGACLCIRDARVDDASVCLIHQWSGVGFGFNPEGGDVWDWTREVWSAAQSYQGHCAVPCCIGWLVNA